MTIKNVSEILKYLENHTWIETSKKFGISEMSIYRILKQQRESNLIEKFRFTNKLISRFKETLKKPINEMNINELRIIYYLLYGHSRSFNRLKYIKKIRKKVMI